MRRVVYKYIESQGRELSEYRKGRFSKRRAKFPFLETSSRELSVLRWQWGCQETDSDDTCSTEKPSLCLCEVSRFGFPFRQDDDRLSCSTVNWRSHMKSTSRKTVTEQSVTVMSLDLQCIIYAMQTWIPRLSSTLGHLPCPLLFFP